MHADRRIAVATGIAFIVATVGSIASGVLLMPILGAQDYLARIAANQDQFLLGVLFQLVGAVGCPAIALALYPVLRRHDEGLAIGSVGFRLIEGSLYVALVVVLLLLVTLSREATGAGAAAAAAYRVPAMLLMAARDWLGPVAAVLTFGIGGCMYYVVLYRARLIPRWLSGWGLAGVTMVSVAGLLVMFGRAEPLGTTQVVLAAPIGLQEMVLAVWLIARGFNPSAGGARPAGETPNRRAAAPSAVPAA
jgi:hypothetical protein